MDSAQKLYSWSNPSSSCESRNAKKLIEPLIDPSDSTSGRAIALCPSVLGSNLWLFQKIVTCWALGFFYRWSQRIFLLISHPDRKLWANLAVSDANKNARWRYVSRMKKCLGLHLKNFSFTSAVGYHLGPVPPSATDPAPLWLYPCL